MSESDRPESAGMTWFLYLLCGVVVVANLGSEADDCWPMATLGVVGGWTLGAFFLAYYVPHLHEGVDRWLHKREVAKNRRKRKRRARRQRRR